MTDHILIERRGAVQFIRMNRPDKKMPSRRHVCVDGKGVG